MISWSWCVGYFLSVLFYAFTGNHRVVNIALLVLLPIVYILVILFEYWHKFRRLFSYAVSILVSAILFHLFLGNI